MKPAYPYCDLAKKWKWKSGWLNWVSHIAGRFFTIWVTRKAKLQFPYFIYLTMLHLAVYYQHFCPIFHLHFNLVYGQIFEPFHSWLFLLDKFFTFQITLSLPAAAKLLQLCPTLCNSIDGSPPGSPVPGILQARVLEWGAIPFSISLPTVFHFIFTITTKLQRGRCCYSSIACYTDIKRVIFQNYSLSEAFFKPYF